MLAVEEFTWTCACDAKPDPIYIFDVWTCPWCGSRWQTVEFFPNDMLNWWQLPERESFPTENALSGENGGGGNRTRVTSPPKSPSEQEDRPRPLGETA